MSTSSSGIVGSLGGVEREVEFDEGGGTLTIIGTTFFILRPFINAVEFILTLDFFSSRLDIVRASSELTWGFISLMLFVNFVTGA